MLGVDRGMAGGGVPLPGRVLLTREWSRLQVLESGFDDGQWDIPAGGGEAARSEDEQNRDAIERRWTPCNPSLHGLILRFAETFGRFQRDTA